MDVHVKLLAASSIEEALEGPLEAPTIGLGAGIFDNAAMGFPARYGGGQNRLGAALMLVRAELLAEDGASSHGWPEGVPRPAWVAGAAVAVVAEDTDGWQRVVKSVAAQLAARTADDGSVLPE